MNPVPVMKLVGFNPLNFCFLCVFNTGNVNVRGLGEVIPGLATSDETHQVCPRTIACSIVVA